MNFCKKTIETEENKITPFPALVRAVTSNAATGNDRRLVYTPKGLSKKQLTRYNRLVEKLNNEEISHANFEFRRDEILEELKETQDTIIRKNFVSSPEPNKTKANKADKLNHFYYKHDKFVSAFFVLEKIAFESGLSLAVITVNFSAKLSSKLRASKSPASAYTNMIRYILKKLQTDIKGAAKGLLVIEEGSNRKEKEVGDKNRLHTHILTVMNRADKPEALKLFRKHTDNHDNSVEIQFENIIKRPLVWTDELHEEEGILDSNTTIDRENRMVTQMRPLDLGVVDYFSKFLSKKLSNDRNEKRNYSLIGITDDVNHNHRQRYMDRIL